MSTRRLTPRELRHLVGCIDRVTRYVEHCAQRYRSKGYRPPRAVVTAARAVRGDVDIAALRLVLDYLEMEGPNPPSRVGAAVWDLGGPVFELLQRQVLELQRAWREAA